MHCAAHPMEVGAGALTSRPATSAGDLAPSVVIKIRPLLPAERSVCAESAWSHDKERIWQSSPSRRMRTVPRHPPYGFNRVYGPTEDTRLLHEERVSAIVQHTLRGFNAAVMAYGETASGKTTMVTGNAVLGEEGLVAMCVQQLLHAFADDDEPSRWSLKLSYLEIYNEVVNDLLTGASGLTLNERKDGTLVITELREVDIGSSEAAKELLGEGGRRRHERATMHNDRSSRAHLVCRLRVVRRSTQAQPSAASSELNIVDLAGSERLSAHSQGVTSGSTRESRMINQSLLVLSTVIHKLVEAGEAGGLGAHIHVPFRSSKVTRLLQSSLSGRAVALIICNITCATTHVEETHNTLRFAARARLLSAAPASMAKPEDASLRVQRYEAEIAELKAALAKQAVFKARQVDPAVLSWENAVARQHAAWGSPQKSVAAESPGRAGARAAYGSPPLMRLAALPGESPQRLAALLTERQAAVTGEHARRLSAEERTLATVRKQLAQSETRVHDLEADLQQAIAEEAASSRRAEEAIARAEAAEAEVDGLQAEVVALAAATRQVAVFERDATRATREDREQKRAADRASPDARESALEARLVDEVLVLKERHEAALKRAIDSKDEATSRERDSIRRTAARERDALTCESERMQQRQAELEQALQDERDARARDLAGYEAACAAEVAAMQHAIELEGELELKAAALLLQQGNCKPDGSMANLTEPTDAYASSRAPSSYAVDAGDHGSGVVGVADNEPIPFSNGQHEGAAPSDATIEFNYQISGQWCKCITG